MLGTFSLLAIQSIAALLGHGAQIAQLDHAIAVDGKTHLASPKSRIQ
jgi:hypothetical protein